jgi:hypothetical protein
MGQIPINLIMKSFGRGALKSNAFTTFLTCVKKAAKLKYTRQSVQGHFAGSLTAS